MGTEERPDRPTGTRARNVPSSVRRRIPLPPLPGTSLPQVRKVAGQTPVEREAPFAAAAHAKPESPATERPAERPAIPEIGKSGINTSGISDEESDLLLDGSLLDGGLKDDEFESLIGGDEDAADLPGASAATDLPADSAAGASSEGEAPGHPPAEQAAESGVTSPPERPGAPGAEVLNDLVEEIEKDLEEEVNRLTLQTQKTLPTYRKTIPCSFVPVARPDGPKMRTPRKDS